jgi:hypothetical protein
MKGSNTLNQLGIYGTQVVPDINNMPGARSAAINWRDSNDNIWLYGGNTCISIGVWSTFSDMWELTP